MAKDDKKAAAKKLIAAFLKENKLEENSRVKIGFMSDDDTIGNIEKMKSGNIAFDTLTNGGYARGHINLIYGAEGVGKTTLFIDSMVTAQKLYQPYLDAYLNNEKSFDRTYANSRGIDKDTTLLVGEFETTEQSADFCLKCADADSGVDRLFIDTLQALSPEGELRTGKDKAKSVADNTMALIPRTYSQFLRMYTSSSVGTLTLVLGSQVRVDLGSYGTPTKNTGGNAIGHYNILSVEISKCGFDNWPGGKERMPPNSFPVKMRLKKAKFADRYVGNDIIGYFYQGSFERKFNVLAISKDLGLHDGKSITYYTPSDDQAEQATKEVKEIKARGIYEMYDKIPDEAIDWLETQLAEAYTRKVMEYKPKDEDVE